ncbi:MULTISPECIES: omptin family outer membrane protease [unclassified Escherichia]|uniref:omptin family outer membrane protease n=1 Tax=unclassified Escherichia TaxID=2608889 RepID=UPI0023EF5534|nr:MULTISPECIES: omptin family outer membrane protease [unclassified Escherichia]
MIKKSLRNKCCAGYWYNRTFYLQRITPVNKRINTLRRECHTIGYQQKYRVPYLGLTGKYVYQDFDITAQFKFSPWVEARDHDEHYMRDLSFNESASNSNYYSGTINAGYNITSQARVFTELSWTRFSEGRGDSTVHDKVTGDSEHYNDAAGIQNYNYAIGAGIEYRF